MIEKINIGEINPNPDNPRVIKDDKFKKLVKSIKDFPQMLEIRPIVVDEDLMVLGGNMRLKACEKAGLKEVFIIKANNLSKEQKKEFIIKDNVGYGEWDWDIIKAEWDYDTVLEWGLDFPSNIFETDSDDDEENLIIDNLYQISICVGFVILFSKSDSDSNVILIFSLYVFL